MSKKRRSVSIDKHLDEQIREDDAEFSPLVNKWAEDYYLEQRRPVVEDQRIDEMIQDLDQLEEQIISQIQSAFDRHRTVLQNAKGNGNTSDEDIEAVYNTITDWVEPVRPTSSSPDYVNKGTPRDPNNPAIRHHAKQLGMSPDDLVEELRTRDRRDGFVDIDGGDR